MNNLIWFIFIVIMSFICLFSIRYAVIEFIDLYYCVLTGKFKKLESEDTNEK